MRRAALALLAVAGCGGPHAAEGPSVDCTEGAAWTRCALERDGAALVVRHADGSFRRYRLYGAGAATADGAPGSATRLSDGRWEVATDEGRVRLPAK